MGVKIDTKSLEKVANKLKNLSDNFQKEVVDKALNELSARVLRKAIKQTPRDTSNLVRNWQVSLLTTKSGNTYTRTVYNPTEYAVYVEYGHRTRGPHIPENYHKTTETSGWVPGFFMLTKAVEAIDKEKNKILGKIIDQSFGDLFND